jgi:hypothetical protein
MLAYEWPLFPDVGDAVNSRLHGAVTWMPPGTRVLARHRAPDGRRRVTASRTPPPGFEIEFDLGIVHVHGQPGTHRILATPDGFLGTVVAGDTAVGYQDLGYVETHPLPMLDALEIRRVRETGELTLVCGVTDPLFPVAEPVQTIGFVDSYPIHPRHVNDLREDRPVVPSSSAVPSLHLLSRFVRRLRAVLAPTPIGSAYRRLRGRS